MPSLAFAKLNAGFLEKEKDKMYVYHPRRCHVRMRPYRLIRDGKLLLKRDRHRDKTRAYRRLDSINCGQIGWPSTSASPAHRKETATPSGRHDSRYRMQPRSTDATPPSKLLRSTAPRPTSTRTSLVPLSPPCNADWHALSAWRRDASQPLPIGTNSPGAGLPNHQLALAQLLES